MLNRVFVTFYTQCYFNFSLTYILLIFSIYTPVRPLSVSLNYLRIRFVHSNTSTNMRLLWLLFIGIPIAWSTELQPEVQPQLVQFFSVEYTSRPISPSQNDSNIDKQDLRVETGLFFDLNKDYDEDDCEEEKEKDCDGWWFWPFEADQSERASIQNDNLLALAQKNSHGLFTGQNLDPDNVSIMRTSKTSGKHSHTPTNNSTTSFTFRNSSLTSTPRNSTSLKNSSTYSGYSLPGTQTLPCFNGVLILALVLVMMN